MKTNQRKLLQDTVILKNNKLCMTCLLLPSLRVFPSGTRKVKPTKHQRVEVTKTLTVSPRYIQTLSSHHSVEKKNKKKQVYNETLASVIAAEWIAS